MSVGFGSGNGFPMPGLPLLCASFGRSLTAALATWVGSSGSKARWRLAYVSFQMSRTDE
jgi:hypothetical protein